jgi:elongation factor P--beta-lysine ligase
VKYKDFVREKASADWFEISAMGIDTLCMMLLGQESIRDVILFPQLKPK